MLFHFQTPRTRDWEKYLKKLQKYLESNPATAHISAFVLKAQEKRCILVKLLDECAKDVSRPDDIIKILDEYIPLLDDLICNIDANNIKLIGYLDIVWTSFLMININGKSLSNSLKWDKICCYILYGLAHYQKAVSLHHINRQISQKTKDKVFNEQKKDFDPIFSDPADYNQLNKPQIFDDKNRVREISKYLRECGNIWYYCSNVLYPVLIVNNQYDIIPETFKCIPGVLSDIALCNTQEFMIQLAVQTNKSDSLTSKLSMGVSKKLNKLNKLLSTNLSTNIYNSIKKDFILYLKIRSDLYQSISLKYHAKLLKKQEKHGECCAYYQASISILKKSINKFNKNTGNNNNNKNKNKSSSVIIMKKSINKQLQSVNQLYNAAKSENDSVYFDVVPKLDDIIYPEPKFVIKVTPYNGIQPQINNNTPNVNDNDDNNTTNNDDNT